MIDLLQNIVDMFVCWIETGVMVVVNLIIVGIAAAMSGIFALLPDMPAALVLPTDVTNSLAAADYYVPLTFIVTLIGTCFTLILAIWLIKIPMRWVRASE
jgi:hypothetical protein